MFGTNTCNGTCECTPGGCDPHTGACDTIDVTETTTSPTTVPSTTIAVTTTTTLIVPSTTITPHITTSIEIETATTIEVSGNKTNGTDQVDVCNCPSNQDGDRYFRNMTAHQLQEVVRQLREEMMIDRSTLSSTKRRLMSASDDRLSACAIGGVGGFVLISVAMIIILADVSRIRKSCTQMFGANISRT